MEKLKGDKKLKTARITEIGYQGLTINVGKSEKAQQNPLGKDARVREALELSHRPQGLAQVVMDNEAQVGNQWVAPTMPGTRRTCRSPSATSSAPRRCSRRRASRRPSFTLGAPTTSDAQRLAVVIQAMARDAGFDVKIQAAEFATSLNMADKGDFEAYVLAWSGRPDPDGNLFSFHGCKQPLNYAGYCDAQTDSCWRSRARPRSGGAQEGVRADRGAGAEGAADHLSLPPQLALGLQRQAGRRARPARRAAAGDGLKMAPAP
jgi:peptide/nickel transport system substrate-binding protein